MSSDSKFNPLTSASDKLPDDELDVALRPSNFDEFTGQKKLQKTLKYLLQLQENERKLSTMFC